MHELFSVANKVVLVTGGSRGIGEMIARGYVAHGAKVYITARSAGECQALADELQAAGGQCRAVVADLRRSGATSLLLETLLEEEGRLDVLINNAGAMTVAPLDQFSEEDWDADMDLNAKAVFFTTQALLPLLRAAASRDKPARVINIASVNATKPPPMGTYAYAASKAACVMLTRHLAKRLARENILVNAIAPGPFRSRITAEALKTREAEIAGGNPLGRLGAPDDIAGVAIFLGSAASAFITGALVPCDGGSAQF